MHPAAQISLDLRLESCRVGAFRIPTDAPESDGTLEWEHTTLVVVEVSGGRSRGLGFTYGHSSLRGLIADGFDHVLRGKHGLAIEAATHGLNAHFRNEGQGGASAMAISALDIALWDLKAKELGLPLVSLLGPVRDSLPVYGSGGFTSYSNAQLRRQFEGWREKGIIRFKMKVGRNPAADESRIREAREVVGEGELMIDANSAYSRAQARLLGERYAKEFGVCWLEQPLSPDDLDGLRFLREQMPAGLEIADGEYGYGLDYFRRALSAQAIDVAMADATRCGGVTGFLKVAHLCEAWMIPMSSHCAPSIHLAVGCAAEPMRHAEYFHDHERIERMFFDGVQPVVGGTLSPDLTVAGHGLNFKWSDAERYVA